MSATIANAAVAGANVLIYAVLAWLVIGRFASPAQARFGALCVAAGFAVGNFAGHAGGEAEVLLVARGMGQLVAFALLIGVGAVARQQGKRLASTRA
jgi:hypothetical protein